MGKAAEAVGNDSVEAEAAKAETNVEALEEFLIFYWRIRLCSKKKYF